MSSYENGIETKNQILAACRKLFYLKGYDNTTFVDICKEAQVNQSSIHYHFKSKERLLQIIYGETIQKNNRIAEKYCNRNTLPSTRMMFGGTIYYYKVLHDEKYRRFNLDAARLSNSESFDEYVSHTAGPLMQFSDQNVVVLREEAYLELMTMAAFDKAFLIYVDQNIATMTMERVQRLAFDIHRRIRNISDEEYTVTQNQLAELIKKCKWEELDTTLEP